VLAGYGANFEVGSGSPDAEILRRVLRESRSGKLDSRVAKVLNDPEKLSRLLSLHPELLRDTLVVRGSSYMVGSDPARLQSLMY
jgi:hypothetical protein